jgi:hypothetical protein
LGICILSGIPLFAPGLYGWWFSMGAPAFRLDGDGHWIAVEPDGEHACPVCGFTGLDRPPHDRRGVGSLEICWCCGTQFGFTDWKATHAELREKWVRAGMRWHSAVVAPPPGWNPLSQLTRETAREGAEGPRGSGIGYCSDPP